MSNRRRIYLDQAATSWPKLPSIIAATEQFIRECGATSGRGAYESARVADQWVMRARHALAQLLGARDAADVAFCSSGTHALNAAISGLLRPGDTVVTTAIEHNSVLRPLEHWRKLHGVQLSIAPCDATGFVQVPERVQGNSPRLVIVSHASNVSGRLQDLAAWSRYAHQQGALLIVDASQSVGYIPINMRDTGVDVLVSAGHKGLGAMSGTGFILAEPEIREQFQPLMWGGTGTSSELLDFVPTWPQSIEVGNLNLPAIVSLSTAAEHWLRQPNAMIEWKAKLAHLLNLVRERFSEDQFQIIGHNEPSYLPVLSCLPGRWDVHEAAAVLDGSFGIETRAGFHCAALIHQYLKTQDRGGTLRLSLGHETSSVDLDETVHALTAMVS